MKTTPKGDQEMNSIEICEMVLKEKVCSLVRLRKGTRCQYDLKSAFSGKKKNWFYLDTFSASAVMAVYKDLKEENKIRAGKIPIDMLVDFAFKHTA